MIRHQYLQISRTLLNIELLGSAITLQFGKNHRYLLEIHTPIDCLDEFFWELTGKQKQKKVNSPQALSRS